MQAQKAAARAAWRIAPPPLHHNHNHHHLPPGTCCPTQRPTSSASWRWKWLSTAAIQGTGGLASSRHSA